MCPKLPALQLVGVASYANQADTPMVTQAVIDAVLHQEKRHSTTRTVVLLVLRLTHPEDVHFR